MLQATTTRIAARVLVLRIKRYARAFIDLGRTILRIVVDTDNLDGILTLYLADSPQTSLQVCLLVIGYHHDTGQWFCTLQTCASRSRVPFITSSGTSAKGLP